MVGLVVLFVDCAVTVVVPSVKAVVSAGMVAGTVGLRVAHSVTVVADTVEPVGMVVSTVVAVGPSVMVASTVVIVVPVLLAVALVEMVEMVVSTELVAVRGVSAAFVIAAVIAAVQDVVAL